MALCSWNTSHYVLEILYHDDMKILGVDMDKIILQSATVRWTTLTGNIRVQAREEYCTDRRLHQQIQYVPSFLLAEACPTT